MVVKQNLRHPEVTLAEAAERLGMTPQRLGRLIEREDDTRSRVIRAIRRDGRIWIRLDELDRFKKLKVKIGRPRKA